MTRETLKLNRTTGDREEEQRKTRIRGVFSGTQKRLDVLSKIDGYHLHWFNEQEDRLILAQANGWEYVSKHEVKLLDTQRVLSDKTTDVGTNVRKVVGRDEMGRAIYGYLMKIQDEFYDEDQLIKIEKNDSQMAPLRKGKGLNSESLGDSAYLPDDRKKALSFGVGRFEDASRFK